MQELQKIILEKTLMVFRPVEESFESISRKKFERIARETRVFIPGEVAK